MTVFSGMLVATLIGVCLVPVLFVAVEKLTSRRNDLKEPVATPAEGPPATESH
jgi:hypothetical protein